MKNILGIVLFLFASSVNALFGAPPALIQWNASWITVPGAGENSPGLYLFRKAFTPGDDTDEFKVHISADNRYLLYVNEKLVSLGPAMGDIRNWNYETVDIAPYLKNGENIVAAKVWNEGNLKSLSQISLRTGFILQGADEKSQVLNTGDSWKCVQDFSYTAIPVNVRKYYAAVAAEMIDMNHKVKGWRKLSFDDSTWQTPETIISYGPGGGNRRNFWQMTPSIIPQMELTKERIKELRRVEGVSMDSSFPSGNSSVMIPANTTASLLLDQTYLTNAYLTLIFSGGEQSNITITYAEALFDENGVKGNRNEIEGKTIFGMNDIVISDGSDNQNFTTLSYRTYRYIELLVETEGSPLVIDDIYGTFTGYPFEFNARLDSDIPELNQMLEIGWRTARLCAVDTYMDCPYYERLQYIGDSRMQLIISYYNSGDDRLAKNALMQFDNSRQPDGYTFSRYPDAVGQIIPTYSLMYISLLHDYMMYRSDLEFIREKLLGVRQILDYFISLQDNDGSLKNVPHWNFTDWATDWNRGTAPVGADGSSAALDLQLLLAFQSAIELERFAGRSEYVDMYARMAEQISNTIQEKYWDSSRRLYADTPGKDRFSQHINSMAILAGVVEGQEAGNIGRLMLTDTSLSQATIYFSYYLHLALTKAGLGNEYLDWLDVWRKSIDIGLTTWAETSQIETTRSDCHAWSSSPNIEFFRIVLGIDSGAPNFSVVKIEPHLGSIDRIGGEMPHPGGNISVTYDRSDGPLKAEITLPESTTGVFIWEGESYDLKEGHNVIRPGLLPF